MCVACVPFGGSGTRRLRNASCRRSASRVVAGPILRLTNQRSPRRTSSARRLIAAPLHSINPAAAAYAPRELDDHSFGPEDIASMSAAFEAALGQLRLIERTDLATMAIAR